MLASVCGCPSVKGSPADGIMVSSRLLQCMLGTVCSQQSLEAGDYQILFQLLETMFLEKDCGTAA